MDSEWPCRVSVLTSPIHSCSQGGGGGPLMSGKVEQTRLITRDFFGNGCCSTSGSNVVVEQFQGPDENM